MKPNVRLQARATRGASRAAVRWYTGSTSDVTSGWSRPWADIAISSLYTERNTSFRRGAKRHVGRLIVS